MRPKKEDKYIPALNFRWLTPLYDPILKWGMREEIFKKRLIEQAQIRPGFQVLDLGCGTGTLTLMIKQAHPQAEVIGLDGDPKVLEIAGEKAARTGVEITWARGMAWELPYPDDAFDRAVSSLVFHHLTTENKHRAFQEILRVLTPGGEFHMIDFGKPRTLEMKVMASVMRHFEETKDNLDGQIQKMLEKVGFRCVDETGYTASLFGPLSLFRAVK